MLNKLFLHQLWCHWATVNHLLYILFLSALLLPHLSAAHLPAHLSPESFKQPLSDIDRSYIPRQLIVTLISSEKQVLSDADKTQRLNALVKQFQLKTGEDLMVQRELALPNRYIYSLRQAKTNSELKVIMATLKSMSGVLSVEEDIILRHTATPDDRHFNQQWSFHEATGGINADVAWDLSTGHDTVVAILDTGYTDHEDLIDSILPGYDFISDHFIANDGGGRDNNARDPGDWLEPWDCGYFDPSRFVPSSWHGTHVSGTVAATTNNHIGISGVAHNTRIVPVRVLGKCGGYLSDIADAIIWASGGRVRGVLPNQHPAHVISMSLGAPGRCSSTFRAAINQALANGSSVIASAGNNRQHSSNHQPANCNGVISVASNDRQGNLAYYSNFGAVTITAPGGEIDKTITGGILSTLNSGNRSPRQDSYAFYQGTSMATPHVAGTAALIYQLAPNTTPAELIHILTNTARPPPGNCNGCGAGIINAAAAVASLQNENQAPSADYDVTTTGLTADFTDTSSDNDGYITAWSWTFGDGNFSSAQHPQHTFSTGSDYRVRLTVTDNSGAEDSLTKTVTVIAKTTAKIKLSHQWARLSRNGRLRVRLNWSGAMTPKVDIYLNNEWVKTTTNDGKHTHREAGVDGKTFTYKLCEVSSTVCSTEHTIEL